MTCSFEKTNSSDFLIQYKELLEISWSNHSIDKHFDNKKSVNIEMSLDSKLIGILIGHYLYRSSDLDEFEILEAINQLKGEKGTKYDVNLVRSEFQKPIKLLKGSWQPEKKLKGREDLLIYSVPTLNEYIKEIEIYIKKKKQSYFS